MSRANVRGDVAETFKDGDNRRIMKGFVSVLEDWPINEKKPKVQKKREYKIGMMIALMLKRSKMIYKLLPLQKAATVVYNQWKHAKKIHGQTSDPPYKWPLEIDKKNRKLTLTFPLIEEWFTDTNYYENIEYVMNLFMKFKLIKDEDDFFRLIRDYLYRSEYERLMGLNVQNESQKPKKIIIKEAGDKAKKRIKNAKEKNELTLSPIYSDQFEESFLIADSTLERETLRGKDEIEVNMGNWSKSVNMMTNLIFEEIAEHKNDSATRTQ